MKIKLILSLFNFLSIGMVAFGQQVFQVQSPDGKLALTVTSQGNISYAVSHLGNQLIHPSTLGVVLSRPELTLKNLEIINSSKSSIKNSWSPVYGERSQIANEYNELKLNLKNTGAPEVKMDVVFRIYNDGLGFRYEFPEQSGLKHFIVEEELSSFHLGENLKAFWIPGDYDTNEFLYHTTPLSEINALEANRQEADIAVKSPAGMHVIQTPLQIVNSTGYYMHIHEAALMNYPVMQLDLDKTNWSLSAHLVPDAVGNKAYLETGMSTPWRTIIISKTPEGILDSDLILNLNDPAPELDYSWIKPKKFIGVWWEMHVGKGTWEKEGGKHAATTENVKTYIDFAAKYGIDGVLVEGWNQGWEDWFGNWKEEVFDFVSPYSDYDMTYLSQYAAQKGVELIMHHETSGSVTNYERRLDQAFDYMKENGINTVKTGYVGKIIPRGEHHDSQWMNRHYAYVGKKALEKKIMVVSHESSRPTGLNRTYPNLLASEAARGNEFNNAPTLGLTPEHETILAFTRLKGGPMDYTPGFFHFKLNQFVPERKTQVNTTLAKQLALFVVFYSPIQMIGDLPQNLEKYPDLLRFIVDIPLDWEKSWAYDAEPGDFVSYVRKDKNSKDWYVAGISDEQSRELLLDFSFLEKRKKYQMTLIQDGKTAHYDLNPEDHSWERKIIDSKTKKTIKMAPGGGFIMKISEVN